jgi:hypothetical protein
MKAITKPILGAVIETRVLNIILKNEFYKGLFGARLPNVKNEP